MPRTDIAFGSGNGTCAGWHYQPVGAKTPGPIIVMGHGLGAVREMRLDAFAERFADAGYQCLVFDYRHFGASSGEPRQLLDIGLQQADWRAAIAYARTLPSVDPERVVLWGTSFGGGHVIHAAARDPRVVAVIAQCPFTDGLASLLAISPLTSMKLTGRGIRDAVGAWFGHQPVMVPTYGAPGTTALMTAEDCAPGMEALVPEGADIPAEVAARFALEIIRYFPGRDAAKVGCPIHFAVCETDTVAPSKATLRHAAKAPKGEIRMQSGGHFDIYVGEDFETNVAEQLAFLAAHVPVAA